jgi:hypothetical protein
MHNFYKITWNKVERCSCQGLQGMVVLKCVFKGAQP